MPERIPILMYHSVSGATGGEMADYTIAPARFREHVRHLRDAGFTGYTTSGLQAAVDRGEPLAERPVVMTFDDAFADFREGALPALIDAGLPATMYAPTAYLGGTSAWLTSHASDRRPIMSAAELRELAEAGIEIGAHSHSHGQLDLLPPARAAAEIRDSKARLEDALDRRVDSFAYPFGYYSRRVKRLVADAGYANAVRVDDLASWTGADRYALPRLIVTSDTTVADLARMLERSTTPLGRVVARGKAVVWRTLRRSRLRERSEARCVADAQSFRRT